MTGDRMNNTRSISDATAQRVLGEIDTAELTDFLQALVRIPTVNPPGDVRAAAELCANKLHDSGFVTRMATAVPEKPNLIAELGEPEGPVLCFNAHLDIVPTGERSAWAHDPFAADLVNGRIYGRGANDDKGSVTAQVMAALAIARSGVPLRGRLVLNEVADEEIGGPYGTAHVVSGGFIKPDYVIVGEPTANRVCLGEKGAAGITITVYGRAAHGALPEQGANAIEGMARVITALQRELWPQLAKRTHPYFHPSSASVNLIDGGVKENVVADHCSVYVDRRLVPGEDPEAARTEIQALAERACRDIPGLRVDVAPRNEGRSAILVEPEAPMAAAMLEANRALGLDPKPTGFSMGTDGRFFSAAGYPAIVYGPGDPGIAHIPDEWVGVDEVLAAAKAYALATLALIGQHE